MGRDKDETVTICVTKREKRAIRLMAADNGKTMSELAREATLSDIPGEYFEEGPTETGYTEEDRIEPLEDFITARLAVDEDATPVAKAEVYQWYQEFLADAHPEHEPETQHKVSREVSMIDGVDAGRRYDDSGKQVRCFLNLRRVETPELNFD